MQSLYLRYKYLSDWIICKKQLIYQLLKQQAPLAYTFRTFIAEYCQYMRQIIAIIGKRLQQTKNTSESKTLVQVLELMHQKEKENLKQWLMIQQIAGSVSQTNITKLGQIFTVLDEKIQYYFKLESRLAQISKIDSRPKKPQNRGDKFNTEVKTQMAEREKGAKSPSRAQQKISEISRKYDSLGNETPRQKREIGKIKFCQKQQKQLSPYKSIRYSEPDYKASHQLQSTAKKSYNYDSQPSFTTPSKYQKFYETNPYQKGFYRPYRDYEEKYHSYRTQLNQQMKTDISNRRKIKPHSQQQAKFYGYYPKHDVKQNRDENSGNQSSRKIRRFQYLTQDDDIAEQYRPYTPATTSQVDKMSDKVLMKNIRKKIFNRSPQNQNKKLPPILPVDSLESVNVNDSLGKQLERELPVLIKHTNEYIKTGESDSRQRSDFLNDSLQNILAMSLLESKRWSKDFNEDEKDEGSDDSLDEIRQTGKFKEADDDNEFLDYRFEENDRPKRANGRLFKGNTYISGVEDSLEDGQQLRISFGK